jgi:glycosyltransferase involved in cell wall biosynthesis
MNTEIFFSIIIPTYNRGNIISKAIMSALNQSYTNFEVIIVDDGSMDKTDQVVNNIVHPALHYYRKNNAERGAARNYGISKAKGNYITFLDSDDLLYPQFLKNAYELIRSHAHPPFFHLAYEIKNEKDKVLHKMNYIKSDKIDFIKRGNYLSCIGVFIRKDIAQNFKFNEDIRLSGSEDWELWIRLIAHFGIKTDKRISACLIQHEKRSVNEGNEGKLLDRKNLSLKYAFHDPVVRERFGDSLHKIESHFLTYISLHLAMAKNKKRALVYFGKAFLKNPFIIAERRTGAIIKYLAFNFLTRKEVNPDLG